MPASLSNNRSRRASAQEGRRLFARGRTVALWALLLAFVLAACRTAEPVQPQPPVANDVSYSILQDTVLVVNVAAGVLSNDVDPAGSALSASLVEDVEKGVLDLAADGSFTYTPEAGFVGEDTFVYEASNADDLSDSATVTITVRAEPNQAPEIEGSLSYETLGNTVLQVSSPADALLKNASDPDGDLVSVVAALGVPTALGGTVDIGEDGTFSYRPPAGLNGTDTFPYEVSDGTDATAGLAEVEVGTVVWYVDNSASSGGDGLSDAPFQQIAAASALAADGHIIFVATGSGAYAGNVSLAAGVTLIGTGVDVVVDGESLATAGTAPSVVVDAGPIRLGNATTVTGFTFSAGGGNSGIVGSFAVDALIVANTFTGFSGEASDKAIELFRSVDLALLDNTFTSATGATAVVARLVNLVQVGGMPVIRGNSFTGTVDADLMYISTAHDGAVTVTISENQFAPAFHPGDRSGLFVFVNQDVEATVVVEDNLFDRVGFQSLVLDTNGPSFLGGATLRANVIDNVFEVPFEGILLTSGLETRIIALIQGNSFNTPRSTSVRAVLPFVLDGETSPTRIDATVRSNSITFSNATNPDTSFNAIEALLDFAGSSNKTLRLEVSDNDVAGSSRAALRVAAYGTASNEVDVTAVGNVFDGTNRWAGADSVEFVGSESAVMCVAASTNAVTYATELGGGPGSYLASQADTATLGVEGASDAAGFEALQTSGSATFVGTVTEVPVGTCALPMLP